MNIELWLETSIAKLEDAGVSTAKLDAEVLLADTLSKDRSWLHAHPEHSLQGPTLQKLDTQIDRRAEHEPIAYIRGKSEFYGREFIVSADTLQPRPETETMIDMIKELSSIKVIDVGTGSGCIAITAKLELPASDVLACDISDACIDIAKKNSDNLSADIEVVKSDLIADINVKKLKESTLACNLPYVPLDFNINEAARHEPDLALFGGQDGLDYYRQMFEQIISLPPQFKPVVVLTESMPTQHDALALIARQADYELTNTNDFIQQFVHTA
jgi:release factor glutamine methyltransferase